MTLLLKSHSWLQQGTQTRTARCQTVGCVALGVAICVFLSGCSENPAPPAPKSTTQDQDPPGDVRNAAIPSLTIRTVEAREPRDSDWFYEATEQVGVHFAYRDGSTGQCSQLLESVGGGVGVSDFDNDSTQDLFFTGGGQLSQAGNDVKIEGHSSGLFRNSRDGVFRNVSAVTGIALEASVYTHGCTVTDFDSDGFDDIVVSGYGDIQLWHNLGDGVFTEVADGYGLRSHDWNVSAAAGDFNRDGLVDLYILTYANWTPSLTQLCKNDQGLRDICGPTLYPGTRDHLFENTGTGFRDVTDTAHLVPKNRGLGVVTADIDDDGFLDVVVVNDEEENQLYYGDATGAFTENGVLAGIAYSNTGEREGSMGIDLGDFDADGRPDLWYTNYTQQDNSLLKNYADRGFLHSADSMGLSGVSRPWVGFGTGFADFDCDGWDDLFVINGHVAYERRDSPYYQPPQLFRNEQGQRFTDVSGEGGPYFSARWSGRGSAKVDWNDDGAPDLIVVHQNDPVAVLTNRHKSDHWISVKLIGTASERSAVGATATVETNGRMNTRWKYSGGNYLSHSDTRLLFVLHNEQPSDVVVKWLGGATEVFSKLSPQVTHTLIEGRGQDVAP